jgi:phosphatidylglycerol:prolipoprotein diacylglycerol transferase
MLPFVDQPALHLGPITIYAFGVMVALAAVWGMRGAQQRFQRHALDPRTGSRLASWALLGGMIGAHLFAVGLYFPAEVRDDPWLLLRFWDHISSFGGILGGVAGVLLFFQVGPGRERVHQQWEYLGAITQVFPASLAIGRLGCTLAHDHPGTVTTFPLAFSIRTEAAFDYIVGAYRDAGRALEQSAAQPRAAYGFHDLGWYEFLFLSLVVVPLFQLWQRRTRPGGFYLIAFPLLYLPVRFGLDFLRIADVRYRGLTPAQWVALIALVPIATIALQRLHRLRGAVR